MSRKAKKEFWEDSFKVKQEMWGFDPAKSAVLASDFFVQKEVKTVLIPGIGYGRNAQLFRANGMDVTGIEISETAIALARKQYTEDMTIHHGSVLEMPFDNKYYDGIFCHGLLYLLSQRERTTLLKNCYQQLADTGCMVFTVITKEAKTYGHGKMLSKDRFEMFGGVKIFFYDRESVEREFANFGLQEIIEVNESYPFYVIKCCKRGANQRGLEMGCATNRSVHEI